MFNCTETPFTCYSQIHIIGEPWLGVEWFVGMLGVAFVLQIAANFIWLQVSQVSRELLQYKKEDKRRCILISKAVGWTALSTTIGILRVIFIMGNNLWLYIVILLGDVIGTALASYVQSKDEDNTIDVIIKHLEDDKFADKKKKIVTLLTDTVLDVIIKHLEDNKFADKKEKIVTLLANTASNTTFKRRKTLFL